MDNDYDDEYHSTSTRKSLEEADRLLPGPDHHREPPQLKPSRNHFSRPGPQVSQPITSRPAYPFLDRQYHRDPFTRGPQADRPVPPGPMPKINRQMIERPGLAIVRPPPSFKRHVKPVTKFVESPVGNEVNDMGKLFKEKFKANVMLGGPDRDFFF